MKTPRFPWLAVVLVLTAPSLVRAQQGSVDTPDVTDLTCGGLAHNVPSALPPSPRLKVKIKANNPAGLPLPLVSASIPMVACERAGQVLVREMNEIRNAALGLGYTCTDGVGDCDDATLDGLENWAFTAAGYPCGFLLAKFTNADKILVGSHVTGGGTCVTQAVLGSTNTGQPLGFDFLPQYLVQLNPNGVHGVVTFKVYPLGVATPSTFTVNTASFGNDVSALQNDIATKFVATGIGLAATLANGGSSHFPNDFALGGFSTSGIQMPASPLVRISNIQTEADSIVVEPLAGQILTQETSVPIAASAPGVSPWGMVLLFGVLLLTGYWILQRRQRLSITS